MKILQYGCNNTNKMTSLLQYAGGRELEEALCPHESAKRFD